MVARFTGSRWFLQKEHFWGLVHSRPSLAQDPDAYCATMASNGATKQQTGIRIPQLSHGSNRALNPLIHVLQSVDGLDVGHTI
jgi:hypothetical protein